MKITPGDYAQAEALRIAARLVRASTSSRYHPSPTEIGSTTRKILDGMCAADGAEAKENGR